MSWRSSARAAGVLATVSLVVAGCGGGDSAHHPLSARQQKRFAELRIVYDANLDYLDPALSYTADGWQAMCAPTSGC